MGNFFGDVLKGAVSIIPGVGDFINNQDSNQANKENTIRANQQSAANQASANQSNIDLWKMQTEYNTPTNTMARLSAAGLSPQLAYGQVAESRMSTPPTMQAAPVQVARNTPQANAGQGLNMLALYQQVKNLQAGNELTRAQKLKTEAETELAQSNKKSVDWDLSKNMEGGTARTDSAISKTVGAGRRELMKVLETSGKLGSIGNRAVRGLFDYIGSGELAHAVLDKMGKAKFKGKDNR